MTDMKHFSSLFNRLYRLKYLDTTACVILETECKNVNRTV